MKKLGIVLIAGLTVAACVTPEEIAANNAAAEEADSIRFIPAQMASSCEYVDQVRATAGLSFFGGMDATEKTAEDRLKIEAVKVGGDSVHIADRLMDKGRGGADQTRLTLYGDVYKCGE